MLGSMSTPRKPPRKPLVLGISGGTGSGKTTIARAIVSELPQASVAYLQHDAYYRDRPDLAPEARAAVNYDHPESLETELLVAQLDELCRGKAVPSPLYDFVTHRRRLETTEVRSAPVIVVEGILIFADQRLRERFDIKIFVDTPADIRVDRKSVV